MPVQGSSHRPSVQGVWRFSAAVLMQPGPLTRAAHVIPLPACKIMQHWGAWAYEKGSKILKGVASEFQHRQTPIITRTD